MFASSESVSTNLAFGPLRQEIARLVLLAHARTEESEGGGFADDQADLVAGDVGFGAFFHAERNDAQGSQRRGRRGWRGRRFRCRRSSRARAAANAHASARFGRAVIGGAAGDGVVVIVIAGQDRRAASPNQLPMTSSSNRCEGGGFEHAAVE